MLNVKVLLLPVVPVCVYIGKGAGCLLHQRPDQVWLHQLHRQAQGKGERDNV